MELTAFIDCSSCGTSFEGTWWDDSIDPEQRDAAPSALQVCPSCGYSELAEYPGWSYLTEAG